VRVIAGTARGRPLRASATIRPTADRIKGSIFSILEALAYKRGFEPDEEGVLAAALAWPRVLDLFAGSGALGIEALSRGAQHASFVEHDREAARTIEANLRATGLDDRGHVHLGPLHLGLGRVRGPFDLVFADPPYSDAGAVSETVERLGKSDLLLPSSVLILEQPAANEPPPAVGPLPLSSTRRHGRTRITVYSTAE
jgi:16S rRNA (guanine(966)-N(2))-methyltransferase RsmD